MKRSNGRCGVARLGPDLEPSDARRKQKREKAAAVHQITTAAELGITDPRDFLIAAMQGRVSASPVQIEAATALLPYFHSEAR